MISKHSLMADTDVISGKIIIDDCEKDHSLVLNIFISVLLFLAVLRIDLTISNGWSDGFIPTIKDVMESTAYWSPFFLALIFGAVLFHFVQPFLVNHIGKYRYIFYIMIIYCMSTIKYGLKGQQVRIISCLNSK